MKSSSIPADVIRLPLERELTQWILVHVAPAERVGRCMDERSAIRALQARAIRLTPRSCPSAFEALDIAMSNLGCEGPVLLYQSADDYRSSNARILFVDPPVIELLGPALELLEPSMLVATLGHELGHHLAHRGSALPTYPELVRSSSGGAWSRAASALLMACEITADRYALLAARDLETVVRTEMAFTTGLRGGKIELCTDDYLSQARDFAEELLATGERSWGETHPEHLVRVYASWLFSRTPEYAALAGDGPRDMTLGDANHRLARLIRPELLDEVAKVGGWALLDDLRDAAADWVREIVDHREPEPAEDLGDPWKDELNRRFAELERRLGKDTG